MNWREISAYKGLNCCRSRIAKGREFCLFCKRGDNIRVGGCVRLKGYYSVVIGS